MGRLRRLAGAAVVDIGPLRRSRNYRLIYAGHGVSLVGTMITFVAVPYQMFRLTHSSLQVGLLGLAEFAPLLLAATAGGVLADARDRRRLVLLAQGGRLLLSAGLVVNAATGAPQIWFLYAAPAAGAMAATVASAWVRRIHHHGRAILWAAGGWGLAIVAFGLAPSALVALACLGVAGAAGAADMISGLFRMTMWNETVPDRLRGRLAAIELLSYSSGPSLGNVEAGTVASVAGVQASIVSGGVLCVLGCRVLAMVLPELRRYDNRRSDDRHHGDGHDGNRDSDNRSGSDPAPAA